MTARTRHRYLDTLTAAERLAEFERQDRLERRVFWASLTLGVLATAGWVVALL